MRSQSVARRDLPESIPNPPTLADEHDAADQHAREMYLMIAESIPGGRKALGLRARRIACFVNGKSAPTAADWERLLAAGAPREDVITYYESTVETLKQVPVPDVDVEVSALLREGAESVVARLEYEKNPTLETAKNLVRESLDGRHVYDLNARYAMRENHRVVQASAKARARFGLEVAR